MITRADFTDRDRDRLERRVTPTGEQWAAWKRTVLTEAPDLAEMLLGERAS